MKKGSVGLLACLALAGSLSASAQTPERNTSDELPRSITMSEYGSRLERALNDMLLLAKRGEILEAGESGAQIGCECSDPPVPNKKNPGPPPPPVRVNLSQADAAAVQHTIELLTAVLQAHKLGKKIEVVGAP